MRRERRARVNLDEAITFIIERAKEGTCAEDTLRQAADRYPVEFGRRGRNLRLIANAMCPIPRAEVVPLPWQLSVASRLAEARKHTYTVEWIWKQGGLSGADQLADLIRNMGVRAYDVNKGSTTGILKKYDREPVVLFHVTSNTKEKTFSEMCSAAKRFADGHGWNGFLKRPWVVFLADRPLVSGENGWWDALFGKREKRVKTPFSRTCACSHELSDQTMPAGACPLTCANAEPALSTHAV